MILNRPFDDAQHDFEKMWRFLQQDYAQKQDRFSWLVSRLGDWRYGLWNEKKYIPTFFRDYAQLWVDAFDQLQGFVLSENGDNIIYIFTAQGYEYLYAEILAWTVQHWGPRYATLKIEVHEFQTNAITQLERAGFHSLGEIAVTRQYDLHVKANEPVKLASGFRIMTMAENADYACYAAKGLLFVNGFDGKDQATEFDLLRFEYSRQNPAYDPSLDFSVITPEGMQVASCVGFIDPAYGMAEVEKVCTHSQYRRQGLAEAVIHACFQRLSQRGFDTAYITGYSGEANGLYEKLGPCKRKQWFHYELERR
jgi:ribosomal protein S18 acetylase RimI-like enzyme